MFAAVEKAAPIVHLFVERLNRHVFTPVIRYPPTGQGVARAQKRLAAKLKANEAIPDPQIVTRQQARAAARAEAKGARITPAEAARRAMKRRRHVSKAERRAREMARAVAADHP